MNIQKKKKNAQVIATVTDKAIIESESLKLLDRLTDCQTDRQTEL